MRLHLVTAAACAALLAACGGGGTDDTSALGTESAQGYAADATTMPVAAATGAEAAVGVLEAALGGGRRRGGPRRGAGTAHPGQRHRRLPARRERSAGR